MLAPIRYLLGIVLFSFSVLTFAATPPQPTSILYTQSAQVATINTVNGKTMLTLEKIFGNTVWFTDRPDRAAGRLDIKQYLKSWEPGDDSFATVHPNALFMYSLKEEVPKNICHDLVVELSNPVYNKQKDSLTYQIDPVGKIKSQLSDGTYYNVMLFIDSAPWRPFGSWP